MRTTRVLAIVAILGIALSFRASANVAYDSETTNTWFKVEAAKPGDFSEDPWTKPKDGEVSVVDSKIALDTDLDDPLIYTPTSATGPVVTVTAQYTATANAATPDLTDTPQAALAVIADGADTNWYGLVKKDVRADWEKFTNVIPTVGETYTIHIDLNNETHRIRYWVGDTILGEGWYENPKSAAETKVTSVSFVGTGDIGDFGGDVITENGATFNGTGYATFADALAAAKTSGVWADGNPIVLYKNAAYEASATETLYVNPNGKTFTINGSVVTKISGNTYTVTAQTDCEASIGGTYYVTFDEAVAAAAASDVIVVNKAITKDLTVAKSYGLNPDGKLKCGTLTVNVGQTLTLADGLAVTTATINGAVAGNTLTVNGTLTGVNVAKLTFGNTATFAYAGAKLAPTTLTMGTTLTITGLNTAEIGTEVITATGLDASKISATLPEGRCLEVKNNTLTVVKEIFATITASSETEGYDYTNGTVSVTANVKDGKTATAVLTVIGWDGTTKEVAARDVTSGTALTWDVAAAMEGALTQGGAYTYTVEVMVDNKVAAVKSGEFTAAKWGADGAWFKADATTGSSDVFGGAWAGEMTIDDNKYEVSDSRFDVMSDDGSNKFTRVDTKIAFETLVDDTPDNPDGNTVGGFVATTQGWMAFNGTGWVLLTGADAPAPVAGQDYVIRAEFDFAAVTKRMRFFVAEGEGDFFPLAVAGGSQWLSTGVANQETLKAVEFQGSGKLESIMATVADKALFEVNHVKYDNMNDALAAAGTTGENPIKLLTNATIEPNLNTPGKYVIVPDGHDYMSGGNVSSENKTIIVEGTGKPPVVRLNDSEMKEVKLPGVTGSVQNTDKLRKFLEDSKIDAYTGDDASADGITQEMLTSDTANGLVYWQDYALGIVVGTSVAPVTTPAGDTNPDAITLAIPTIDKGNYSGDYDIRYQVLDGSDQVLSEENNDKNPSAILIPLTSGTGTYSIKAVFTPKTVPEQTVSGN